VKLNDPEMKGKHMIFKDFSTGAIGWIAIATGIVGLLGFIFIILLFSVGQPFGTLNDICIGVSAFLSLVLVWKLSHVLENPFSLVGRITILIALIGTLLVLVGSTLSIFAAKGWFQSGLYMAAGYGMIGLCLLVLNYSALRSNLFPQGQAILGLISAVVLALGLVTIPAIFQGIDSKDYEITVFNVIWWTGSLGYLALYPIWCILVGRMLLRQ
jgi:hypothetical protein